VTKYGFNIRTRGGQKVDNIVIMAQDCEAAERRLRQMYTQCEILNRLENNAEPRKTAYDVDSLITLIARHATGVDTEPTANGGQHPSTHKPGTH